MSTSGNATPDSGPGREAVRHWYAARARAEAQHDARLVSDAERERVCQLLNGAFSEGRLTAPELDVRTSHALAARTHGDLEGVLAGLTGDGSPLTWTSRPDRGILPRIIFWIVGLFTSPFVLAGGAFLVFGSDLGDHVFGLVLLVIFLPGLIALYRWAHPRS